MPYEFTDYPHEPETQTAAGGARKPPGKGVAVLDFVPPEPHGPRFPDLRNVSIPTWVFILLVLAAIGAAILIHFIPG